MSVSSSIEHILIEYLKQTVEYCCVNELWKYVTPLIQVIFHQVINNNLLDCYLELFFLVCLYDGLNKKEISYYLQLLFQSNSKSSKDDYLLELFIDWKGLNCSVGQEKKQEVLLMFVDTMEEEMNELKLEKIRDFILDRKEDSKKLKRKRKHVSE